jgi:hypothetical protein
LVLVRHRDDPTLTTVTTIGVDLSAQPRETACCVLEWNARSARIVHLDVGYDNAAIAELVAVHRPAKVAIDSPFGWPFEFIRTISDFTFTGRWPMAGDGRSATTPLSWRRPRYPRRHGS